MREPFWVCVLGRTEAYRPEVVVCLLKRQVVGALGGCVGFDR